MALTLNEEQRLLRETAREFLGANAPVGALRALRDARDPLGYSRELWTRMAGLGWAGIIIPEEFGGLGFGFAGLGAVLEETGRTLTASPLFASCVLGASAVLLAGSRAQKEAVLPRVASGELCLALALEESHRHDPCGVHLEARRHGEGFRLNGAKQFVLDGHVADRLIVVARSSGAPGEPSGLSLFLVDPATAGVKVERTWLVDSRNAARVHFAGVRLGNETLIGTPDTAFAALDRVLDRARACVAAELLGVIGETFERTVAYLKERVQFDVPIGSFQALQHRAARLHVEIELLRSCVAAALTAADAGEDGAASLASLAKGRAADLGEKALNEAVQMHGGIGVTDELEIGLFLKRARVLQQTFGDGSYHRDRYAKLRRF